MTGKQISIIALVLVLVVVVLVATAVLPAGSGSGGAGRGGGHRLATKTPSATPTAGWWEALPSPQPFTTPTSTQESNQ